MKYDVLIKPKPVSIWHDFSSMAVRSYWILGGTGTRCHIRRSRASQTYSMGDMYGEYHPHDAIHTVYRTVKNGIHPWREHLSRLPDGIKCEHDIVRWRTAVRSKRRRQFVQKLFGYANWLLQQLSRRLVSDDLGGEDAGRGGPGLVWLHVVCGCEAGWMYCQILWNAFGDGLW